MSSLVLQLLTGLASASALFLVASGLSLIFGVTRIVNFAHGSFYMLGLYGAVALSAALAAGLTLIFGVTRIVNFAHGSFYMLGAYVAYSAGTMFGAYAGSASGFFAAALVAAVGIGVLGALIDLVLQKAQRRILPWLPAAAESR
jgi:branched-subunit amino acid ABC-type transport system permease component